MLQSPSQYKLGYHSTANSTQTSQSPITGRKLQSQKILLPNKDYKIEPVNLLTDSNKLIQKRFNHQNSNSKSTQGKQRKQVKQRIKLKENKDLQYAKSMPNTELEILQLPKNKRIQSDKGDLMQKKVMKSESTRIKAKALIGNKNQFQKNIQFNSPDKSKDQINRSASHNAKISKLIHQSISNHKKQKKQDENMLKQILQAKESQKNYLKQKNEEIRSRNLQKTKQQKTEHKQAWGVDQRCFNQESIGEKAQEMNYLRERKREAREKNQQLGRKRIGMELLKLGNKKNSAKQVSPKQQNKKGKDLVVKEYMKRRKQEAILQNWQNQQLEQQKRSQRQIALDNLQKKQQKIAKKSRKSNKRKIQIPRPMQISTIDEEISKNLSVSSSQLQQTLLENYVQTQNLQNRLQKSLTSSSQSDQFEQMEETKVHRMLQSSKFDIKQRLNRLQQKVRMTQEQHEILDRVCQNNAARIIQRWFRKQIIRKYPNTLTLSENKTEFSILNAILRPEEQSLETLLRQPNSTLEAISSGNSEPSMEFQAQSMDYGFNNHIDWPSSIEVNPSIRNQLQETVEKYWSYAHNDDIYEETKELQSFQDSFGQNIPQVEQVTYYLNDANQPIIEVEYSGRLTSIQSQESSEFLYSETENIQYDDTSPQVYIPETGNQVSTPNNIIFYDSIEFANDESNIHSMIYSNQFNAAGSGEPRNRTVSSVENLEDYFRPCYEVEWKLRVDLLMILKEESIDIPTLEELINVEQRVQREKQAEYLVNRQKILSQQQIIMNLENQDEVSQLQSPQFVSVYIKLLKQLMIQNGQAEEFLELYNSPLPSDPEAKLAALKAEADQFKTIYNSLELIIPSELSQQMMMYLGSEDSIYLNLYCQTLFDGINEALNYTRPYGIFGEPQIWSKETLTLCGNFDMKSIFQEVKSLVIDWLMIRSGILPESLRVTPTLEQLQRLREKKLHDILCYDIQVEDKNWARYEDDETQVVMDISDMVFEFLTEEVIMILDDL